MKPTARYIIAGLIVCIAAVTLATPVSAQFTPGVPHWQFDPETTQVGRNAERARELIWWIYTHPPIYNVEVLSQMWILVRNITYALTLLVIIGLALHLVLTARRIGPTFTGISIGMERLNLANIIVRVLAILLFITFSYVIVRGFIEGAEIATKFIQTIGGQDLFTVVFGTDGNSEANYEFVGYRNYDPEEQDMVFTSLFLVRLTSFTYNFMAIILIMRHIILMYLLILSPMLALLMAFIFIRNTGYIWIGVFFQWLLYGPMFTLFIVSLARIWKAGIPYGFDFSRAGTAQGQVFHTGINILYGGPGQVDDHALSPTNTSNYIDTYAEYVIALVMLWTAILLPWLLLRIFRDFCCDMMERNNAAIVQALDRFRALGQPPKPPKPSAGPAAAATQKLDIELPFRQQAQTQPPQRTGATVSTQQTTTSDVTRERIIEKINNNELHTVETSELQQVYDLKVQSLRDVARLEMQKETNSAVTQTLQQIQNPFAAKEETTQRQFETLRTEITKRAAQGDQEAQKIVKAAASNAAEIQQTTQQVSSQVLREAVRQPGVPVAVSQAQKETASTILSTSQAVIKSVAEKTNNSAERVEQVLKAVPQTERTEQERITMISERVAVPREQVQKVLAEAPKDISVENLSSATILNAVSEKTDVSTEKVEEILKESVKTETTKEERVETLAQAMSMPREEVQKIVDTASTEQINMSTMIASVSEKSDVSTDKVEQVLSEISETEKEQEERITTLSERVSVPREQVQQIVAAVPEGTSTEQISSNTIVKTVAEKTNIDESTVEQVLQQLPQTVQSKEETLKQVAEKVGMEHEEVERVVETAESEREIRASVVERISEKTSVERDKVEQILQENASVSTAKEQSFAERITLVSEKVGIPQEQVRHIGETAQAAGGMPTITPSVIKSVSEKTQTSEENVQQVLTEISKKEFTQEDKVSLISQKIGISQEQVRRIGETASAQGTGGEFPEVTPAIIKSVSEQTDISEETVQQTLTEVSKKEVSEEDKVSLISQKIGISQEQVRRIGETASKEGPRGEFPEVTPAIIKSVSEQTNSSQEQVEKVLTELSKEKETTQVSESEKITRIAEKIGVSEEKVKEVLNNVPMVGVAGAPAPAEGMPIVTPATIQKVSEATQVKEQTVENILSQYPRLSGSREEKEKQLAENLAIAPEEVHKVIGAAPKEEVPVDESGGPKPESPVSIEEYEEVRKMWQNHYRTSEVPVSESVKNREEWIAEDIKTLTNTLELLTSPIPKNRQKGMEQVSTILPFLLLGGFSDVETMTYIKAKLEAAKLTKDELAHVAKVKAEMGDEDLVEIKPEEKAAAATMTAEQAQDMPESASDVGATIKDALSGAPQERTTSTHHETNTTIEKESSSSPDNLSVQVQVVDRRGSDRKEDKPSTSDQPLPANVPMMDYETPSDDTDRSTTTPPSTDEDSDSSEDQKGSSEETRIPSEHRPKMGETSTDTSEEPPAKDEPLSVQVEKKGEHKKDSDDSDADTPEHTTVAADDTKKEGEQPKESTHTIEHTIEREKITEKDKEGDVNPPVINIVQGPKTPSAPAPEDEKPEDIDPDKIPTVERPDDGASEDEPSDAEGGEDEEQKEENGEDAEQNSETTGEGKETDDTTDVDTEKQSSDQSLSAVTKSQSPSTKQSPSTEDTKEPVDNS